MADIPAMVHTANPRVLVTQPNTKMDPRSGEMKVSVASSVFRVDMAFGPGDDNQVVYRNTVPCLLDTALKVNRCLFSRQESFICSREELAQCSSMVRQDQARPTQ